MSIDWLSCHEQALDYGNFLGKYGSRVHQERWAEHLRRSELRADLASLFARFTRRMKVLCLSGTWCGDCAFQCPMFRRFEEAVPDGLLEVRYLDRDEAPALVKEAMRINGGQRVPAVVFLSEDGFETGRYGEKTLVQYRKEVESLQGVSCSLGIAGLDDSAYRAEVLAEWAHQFERNQWILRLSARLREKYGD